MLQPAYSVCVCVCVLRCISPCVCVCVSVYASACVWGSTVHGGKQVPLGGGHTKQSCCKITAAAHAHCRSSSNSVDVAANAQVQCLCLLNPLPFCALSPTHTHADMTNQNKLSTLLSLYSEFHMNFAKIQFE